MSRPRAALRVALVVVAAAALGCPAVEPACCANDDAAAQGRPAEWITVFDKADDRPTLPKSFPVLDADGAALDEVPIGRRPAAIAFFYSRCTNPNKCPTLMHHFADLRSRVVKAGLADVVDTIAISYDAFREHPGDLARYRATLGPDASGIRMLVPTPVSANPLFTAWSIRAQASQEGVAAHTNELILVDREGRLYQRNAVLLWDTDQVMAALLRLAREP